MRRSLLPILLVTTAFAVLPGSAQAIVTPFPVDTNWILSGNAALDASEPMPANYAGSGTEAISADGRYVAFYSEADALSTEDDDSSAQVYVKDRQTGAVTLVSRRNGAAGAPAAGPYCGNVAISADGTRVAFTCRASLDDADTNNDFDVYVRDWQAGTPTTTLVSRGSSLGPVGDDNSTTPSLSATGEYVAFVSRPQLVADDTNDDTDVYRRRIGSGDAVVLVSRKANGGAVGNDESQYPSISDSGQRVAFESAATNLLAAPTIRRNVYLAEPAGGTLALVSSPTLVTQEPNGASGGPALSGDGNVVAFWSTATDLQDGDNDNNSDVHRRNLTTSTTTHVSTLATGSSSSASIDGDGSVVGYVWSSAVGNTWNSYVLDGVSTVLISRRDGDDGTTADGDGADAPALSDDGQVAAFYISGASLTADADPRFAGVYVRDRSAAPDTTVLVSRPAGSDPFVNAGAPAGTSDGYRSVSADGRRVVFARRVGSNRHELVVRDTETGSLTVAGRADGPDGAVAGDAGNGGAISADGTRVAWTTDVALDPVVDGNGTSDVYVRDLATQRTSLASRADGADGAVGSNGSYYPALDADGSRVAFFSYAPNLGDGDAQGSPDIHVRDLATDRTLLASSKDGPAPAPGNGFADGRPAISADGTKVAFTSEASDLGDGDGDAGDDVHLRDMAAGTTRQVSATAGGVSGDGQSSNPSISADGNRVAFSSSANNLIADFPGSGNVYVHDMAANTLVMAGRASGESGDPATNGTANPQITDDGNGVLFTSGAQNLGATFPGSNQAFVRNLASHQTVHVSRDAGGAAIAGGVDGAALSGNGSCLVFTAGPGVIAAAVSPDFDQVYLRAVGPACVPAAASAGTPPAGQPAGQPPVTQPATDTLAPRITAARLTRKRFRVGRRATAVIAAKAGTTLRLQLSEAAAMKVTIQRARPGKKVAGKCKRVRRPVKRNACTVWSRDGVLTRTVTKAGLYRLAFSGRIGKIGKKRLAVGRHRMIVRATDAAGNPSAPVRLRFRIVRGG